LIVGAMRMLHVVAQTHEVPGNDYTKSAEGRLDFTADAQSVPCPDGVC
jgi:hypothetical protein